MEWLLNWAIGSVLVGIGAISIGYGAGMMWRSWRKVTPPDHIIVLQKMNFDEGGYPLDGVASVTRAGRTYRFKLVDGHIQDS